MNALYMYMQPGTNERYWSGEAARGIAFAGSFVSILAGYALVKTVSQQRYLETWHIWTRAQGSGIPGSLYPCGNHISASCN
jgi:hypothetical protein